ncbi:thymidylate kinase [Altererythrobacter xiamenensis]|uniref:Thymidylate kinase n=1 Tax=Altererythrobacter xiamenensis TaxID=1316679 RepID=A0A1Y6FIJ7_9SPHN|nr:dTMP kinase [Altererythrobacter xiamenensis]SMQ74529.1 thymidylate kinase [Altererythrobacter xiamenensis]
MSRGKFIALEGGEGAGKSTQARLLADALEARGIPVVSTREPGGTPGAEAIRSLLLDPPGQGWGAEAEALLFAAARSDHVAKLIRPALERGDWVLSDRFVDSSRAYQGGAGALGDEAIVTLHEIGSQGLRPDLTLLIEADEARVAERLAVRDGDQSDAIGGRDGDYHRAVAAAFRRYAEADPQGFAVIDGSGSPEEVHQRIMQALNPLLGSA